MKIISGQYLLPLLLLLVSACAQQPQRPPAVPRPGAVEPVQSQPAPTTGGVFSAGLDQAEVYLQQRQLLAATSILRELDSGKSSPTERLRHALLEIELEYRLGQPELALQILLAALPLPEQASADMAQQLRAWQLKLTSANHGPLAGARLAYQLAMEFPGDADALHRQLWHKLQRSSEAQLQAELQASEDGQWTGWLELAVIASRVSDSPDLQVAELSLWRQRHPRHPAATRLPGGLGLLAQLQLRQPSHIGLVLALGGPESGNSRAILDAYLATQYRALERGWPAQQLSIIDSADYPGLREAYDAAIRGGAELIIGPHDPRLLRAWTPDAAPPVPVLALDWIEPPQAATWQIGFTAAHEVRQLAQLAFAGGARRALLVRPEGSWGDELERQLSTTWTALEGTIVATAVYSGQDDYSSSLKPALSLPASEQRARRVRQLMNRQLEFTPRRRQDIDLVFLLAQDPQDARSIKPLLAFHYAGDIPVYSTSHIFSGRPDPQLDKDLDGILTLATPWNLSPHNPLVADLLKAGGDAGFSGWYALGSDVFHLHWRLEQLAVDRDSRFRGQTGLLYMDENGRVRRELAPARFSRGVPVAGELADVYR